MVMLSVGLQSFSGGLFALAIKVVQREGRRSEMANKTPVAGARRADGEGPLLE